MADNAATGIDREQTAIEIEDIIVREVGLLSHVEERVVEPMLALIEAAYQHGYSEALRNAVAMQQGKLS